MTETEFERREREMAARIAQAEERYRAERDRRLRADGQAQYRDPTGELSRFVEDPEADPDFAREPVDREVEVLIVGGGFAGLLTATHLRRAGVDDLLILERGGDFGGTWYWNRYPGAACDVESYIYLPMLEEVDVFPSEKYAKAPEIMRHCQTLADRYGLYERALLQTSLTGLTWDEDASRWKATTDRGDDITAQFAVSAGGLLQRPKLPGIPGILDFRGDSFHTSRWDYSVTGGDNRGNMTKLADKRVAVIGTGATALQCVPFLAEDAQHLYVVQRTPNSVFKRDNQPTDPEWVNSLKPGWQQERMGNFTALACGLPEPVDMVNDEFTSWVFGPNMDADPDLAGLDGLARIERAAFLKMERVRNRVDSIVADPVVAEALKPQYRYFCKRPGFHDEFLSTFNRENVTLIDTKGKGVERLTANGIVVDDVEYAVDVIIYATGFELTGDEQRRLGVEIIGRDGLSMNDKFSEGAFTLHGLHSHGFPNLFRISTVQTGVTFNYTHLISDVAAHIAYVIKTADDRGIEVVEATEEAELAWVEEVITLGAPARAFMNQCTPSYFNREGEHSIREIRNSVYGDHTGGLSYMRVLAAWREQDDLAGLETTVRQTADR